MCVRACVHACVRVCARACVCLYVRLCVPVCRSKEMVSTERTLNDERESLRQLQSQLTYLQDTHQQEKQQL